MSNYRLLLILFFLSNCFQKILFNDFLHSFNSSYKNRIASVYDDLFNRRQLFISDINISKQYINFIRDIIEKK